MPPAGRGCPRAPLPWGLREGLLGRRSEVQRNPRDASEEERTIQSVVQMVAEKFPLFVEKFLLVVVGIHQWEDQKNQVFEVAKEKKQEVKKMMMKKKLLLLLLLGQHGWLDEPHQAGPNREILQRRLQSRRENARGVEALEERLLAWCRSESEGVAKGRVTLELQRRQEGPQESGERGWRQDWKKEGQCS